MFKYQSYIRQSVIGIVLLFLVSLTCLALMQMRKNALLETRIQNTKCEFGSIGNEPDIGQFRIFPFDHLQEVLNKTTVSSLKTPTIAGATIYHYQSPCGDNDSLMFQLAWIESSPSIDGVRIRMAGKNIDIRIPSRGIDRNGPVVFFQDCVVFQNESRWQELAEFLTTFRNSDTPWQEWEAILEGLQNDSVYVVLLRRGRVVSKEFLIKQVPPPFVHEEIESESYDTESTTSDILDMLLKKAD